MPTLSRGEIALLRRAAPTTLLAMRCTIQRYTNTGTDDYGQPTGSWTNIYVDEPCWWDQNSGRAQDLNILGPDINALIDTQRIVFRANLPIEEDDRILSVIGVDNVQVAGPLTIEEVVRTVSETAARVQEVGAP